MGKINFNNMYFLQPSISKTLTFQHIISIKIVVRYFFFHSYKGFEIQHRSLHFQQLDQLCFNASWPLIKEGIGLGVITLTLAIVTFLKQKQISAQTVSRTGYALQDFPG